MVRKLLFSSVVVAALAITATALAGRPSTRVRIIGWRLVVGHNGASHYVAPGRTFAHCSANKVTALYARFKLTGRGHVEVRDVWSLTGHGTYRREAQMLGRHAKLAVLNKNGVPNGLWSLKVKLAGAVIGAGKVRLAPAVCRGAGANAGANGGSGGCCGGSGGSGGSGGGSGAGVGGSGGAPPVCPVSSHNVPDGYDPWGGCFPGPQTSGVPRGMALVDVSSGIQPPNGALPAGNTGWTNSGGDITMTSSNAVVVGISTSGSLSGASGLVKDSSIGGGVTQPSGPDGSLTVEATNINGGTDTNFNAISDYSDSGTLTIDDVNATGGGHVMICYHDCTVKNSYLHDTTSTSTAHQNGILWDGGSNNSALHDTVRCENPTGPNDCTSDIALLQNDGEQINESVQKTLILSSPRPSEIAFCVYPGPNYSSAPNPVGGITWEDNVLQKGVDGHCNSHYGEVYGWYPATCPPNNPCIWSGNIYDDGTAWTPPS